MTYRSCRHNAAFCGGHGSRFSRRAALKIGGAGMLGLNMTHVLNQQAKAAAAPPPKARSVIFLYQFGGPTHIDTFDLKPSAPEGIRGPFKSIETSVPGVRVCEHLPKTAKVLDKVCQIRSMHHEMKNHNSASYYALTGHAPPVDDIRLRDSLELFPAYGSVVDHLAPNQNEMPTFVAFPYVIRDGAVTPGQHASFLGKKHDPLLILQDPNSPNFKLPELSLPSAITQERLQDRRSLLETIDKQVGLAERIAAARGIDEYHQRAFSMLSSPKVKKAFDLTQEPEKSRDAYGRTSFGQGTLLARRLVEIGVRLVTVYYCRPSGAFIWDTHKNNFPELKDLLLPTTDQAVPTLLRDLEDRGMLKDTLVVWMGEFGRTPKINSDAGRDHWPQCYSIVMAGGGMKRGFVYGASDAEGAYPTENPVKPENIAGTMYRALGIDPHTEIRDLQNRPLAIGGDPVMDLFA